MKKEVGSGVGSGSALNVTDPQHRKLLARVRNKQSARTGKPCTSDLAKNAVLGKHCRINMKGVNVYTDPRAE
jgi:hypothetical protein